MRRHHSRRIPQGLRLVNKQVLVKDLKFQVVNLRHQDNLVVGQHHNHKIPQHLVKDLRYLVVSPRIHRHLLMHHKVLANLRPSLNNLPLVKTPANCCPNLKAHQQIQSKELEKPPITINVPLAHQAETKLQVKTHPKYRGPLYLKEILPQHQFSLPHKVSLHHQ